MTCRCQRRWTWFLAAAAYVVFAAPSFAEAQRVWVVNDRRPHSVNVKQELFVVQGGISSREVFFRNSGTGAVEFSTLSMVREGHCLKQPPYFGVFEVVRETPSGYEVLSRVGALFSGANKGEVCFTTLTLPVSLTVGAGEALAAELWLSSVREGPNSVDVVAYASGHTLD